MFISVWLDDGLDVERSDIEAELSSVFRGKGRVSGAGTSEMGSHIDLDIKASLSIPDAHAMVTRALESAGITSPARIRICEMFTYNPNKK